MVQLAVYVLQVTQAKALGIPLSGRIFIVLAWRSILAPAAKAPLPLTTHNRESMEIKTKDYTLQYERATQTVTCCGAFRLNLVEEYAPIVDLLNEVADSSPNTVTLDLRKLEFLNSSGINIFSKFVIKVRQQKNIQIAIKGSKQIPWQRKSLKNLQRLMPSLQLELE